MTKALVNIMIVCLIFSILSIVMTSGNDDIVKAKAEAEAAAAEAAAAVAKAKAAAEAAAEAEAEAEAEELDTSLTSFSTSAALSFDDDFIAPDISAGKAPVNCVIGSWTNDGGCNENTGVQKQKRLITPAKHGGTCNVTPDSDGFERRNKECRVRCKGGHDENWSGCTVAGQSCGRSGTEYRYFRVDTAQNPARDKGLVDACPATLTQSCHTPECVIGFEHEFTGGQEIMSQSGNQHTIPNDSMTSIRVPPGNWVQLFQHHDYGGACRDFPSVNEWRDYVLHGFNDTVTSYKVGRGPTQPCPGTNTSQTGTNAAPVSGWGSY
jgi:Tfp pilus assembly protein PilE